MNRPILTLLLVEDFSVDRELYRRCLVDDASYSYRFVETESAGEGLELCRTQPIDAIVLDYSLPDADGLEFLASLRANIQPETPPVVMVTGQGDETIAVRAMKLGAEDYLIKRQLTPKLLQVAIHSAIENARLRQQLRQSEERLQASEERWQLALAANRDGIWDMDLQTGAAVVSDRLAEMFGCEPGSITNFSQFLSLVHPDDLQHLQHTWQQHLDRHTDLYSCEYRVRCADGSYKWILGRGQALWNELDVPVRAIGSLTDITELKANERRWQESQARLELGVRVAGIALARFDYASNTVALSAEAARAYGLGDDSITVTRDRLHATFHPDEREMMEEIIARVIDPAGDGWFEREHRVVWPHGEVRWLNVRKQVFFVGEVSPPEHRSGAAPRPDYAILAAIDITERRRNEEIVRQQLTQIENIYAAAPVGLCYNDRALRFVRINDVLAEINGVPASAHIGRTIREILPELADKLEPIYRQVIDTGEPIVDIEISGTNLAQPGVERHWLASYHPQRDDRQHVVGVNVMVQEITAAKRAETERLQAATILQHSEERYRYLSGLIPQMVWIAQPDGMLLDVNDRWIEYTGMTLARAQISGWQEIVHPEDIKLLTSAWQAAQLNGTRYQAEGRVRRADGIYRWHLHQAMPQADERGQIVRWFGTGTDIHDIKEISAERDRLLAAAQAARAEAEAANRSKDEFVAIVAHELRSPLNSIAGWAKLLQNRTFDTATQTKALETIWRNTQTQVQLVEDLLDISRMVRGKLQLNLSPVNLAAITRAAIDSILPQVHAKQIEIATQLSPHLQVSADTHRLQQIVVNLLTNAIKFTPEGGTISISVDCTGDRVCLQVSDTGKGIAPEFLPYIFERFHQGQKNTGSKDGLGLGLAIVKHLVELHHGSIVARSEGVGRGATFIVELPLLGAPPLSPTVAANEDEATLAGVKMLVVDDAPDMLDLIGFILEEAGAEVRMADSMTAALEILTHFKPDTIVSDIAMPGGNGYELLARIQQLYSEKIPAIALTAYASTTHEERSLQAGFDRHLTKPVDPETLVKVSASLVIRG